MQAIVLALLAVFHADGTAPVGAAQADRRAQARTEQALRREGDALVALADAALAGRGAADFDLTWHNDFFKAQPGTFVPFILTFEAPDLTSRAALLYVRVVRQAAPASAAVRQAAVPAYETIFPVRLDMAAGRPTRIMRGFAVPPGRYRVVVVLRETPEHPEDLSPRRRAGTAVRDLEVPDFWTGELDISSVMLADRLEPLSVPIPADELDEHPYVVGTNRIHPALGASFSRSRELVVVFLVYNPSVGVDKHFDVQVDYHLYRKDQGGGSPERPPPDGPLRGERYVTRTNPQRFNPSMMGPGFDALAGTPILAGQGILLAGFEPGDYRLRITVTDLLSRKSLSRDVAFTVVE
jgi:hypothetical protein